MTAVVVLLALSAGALGSVVRAVVVAALPRAGTGLVNVAGTLVLAVCWALVSAGRLDPGAGAVAGLGFAGALTTFSGWVARVDDGLGPAPVRTLTREVVLPLAAGTALTVAAFIALS
jgi:fluoride ion exporter CrcB/FEX